MIVNGKEIAEDIYSELQKEVAGRDRKPNLRVFTCDPNFETRKFLEIKKKKAEQVGIEVEVIELPTDVTTEECIKNVEASRGLCDGIVVQLPFPESLDRESILKAIPGSHDVDAFNIESSEILPPVVGAMKEILDLYQVQVEGKSVVIVGSGRLVGQPATKWFKKEGGNVTVVTKHSDDFSDVIHGADIVVLGAGSPGMLSPDMIKEGVVILDAGTSEEGGVLKGDANPACADGASIFTPVPGGIGPITIAVLLKNVVILSRN